MSETSTETPMQRITITLDDRLAEELEAFRARHGYDNRSEAFRDLVRERLGAERLSQSGDGTCLATLTYVYNHHARALASRMTQVQHAHHDLTVSTLHVHLDHDDCLETVILRGPVARVQAFADAVTTQPGVRHARLHLLPVTLREQVHAHGAPGHPRPHEHLEPSP
jgi:CopG family nickel-responsive transcriptional regulator